MPRKQPQIARPPDWPKVMEWDWAFWMGDVKPKGWGRPRPTPWTKTGYSTPWTPFHDALLMQAKLARPIEPLDGPLRLELGFHFKRGRTKMTDRYWHISNPDLSNLVKGVEDVLKRAEVIKDDRLVCALSAFKVYSSESGVAIYLRKEKEPDGGK